MKHITLSALLLCLVIPIYAMEDKTAWVPGESGAGILPFRRTNNGIKVLLTKGRKFKRITKDKWVKIPDDTKWSTLYGRCEKNETAQETAIREGIEEMAFPFDNAHEIIKKFEEGKDVVDIAYKSDSYSIFKSLLKLTEVKPHISPRGKKGLSYLYPIDMTGLLNLPTFNALIETTHKEHDTVFFAKLPEHQEHGSKFYTWCEKKELVWVDVNDIKEGSFNRDCIYEDVQATIDLIKQSPEQEWPEL